MKALLILCVLFCGCATTNQVTLTVEIPDIQKPTQGVTFKIMGETK